jgi:hypothetical protein
MKIDKKFLDKNIDKFHKPFIPYRGVKVHGIKIVHRDDINNDVQEGQMRRNDDKTSRKDKFGKSFSGGIDWEKPIPVLELRADGKYDRIDGFGRGAYLDEVTEWYVYLIVTIKKPLDRRKLRTWLNRRTHKDDNDEQTLIYQILDAINKKEMPNTEKQITKFLDDTEPCIDDIFKGRIISSVIEKAKTKQAVKKTWTYTDRAIKTDWIDRHWADTPKYGFFTGNKFNEDGDVYQLALAYGYEKRKLYTVIENYLDGKKTEIILHVTKGVTNLETLNKNRQKLLDNLKSIIQSLDKLYNKKLNWKMIFDGILGFAPQDRSEKIKKLVPLSNFKFNI